MERSIMNNAFLMIAIKKHFEKVNMTETEFINQCIKNDICIGVVSKIKVSPYYFNNDGKKLSYMYLDIDTNIMQPLIKKNRKRVCKNITENRIQWG
jgi:hypothetical protein